MPKTYAGLLRTLFAACALGLAGCPANQQQPGSEAKPSALAAAAPKPSAAVFANQLASGNLNARIRIARLEVFQLKIPLGAVSRSEEFWKHVDETRVDIGTYDLLLKNGWRVGIAPTAEWGYFRDIIANYPASSTPRILSTGADGSGGAMEMPMKEAVQYQVVSYFSDTNALFLRSFDRADNLLNLTVQQVPRKPGEARVTVCPTVRSLRKRFEVTMNNQEREIRYVSPERLYDLNLQVDIPMGHFLVVAPSPEVKWKTSLGATFLVDDGPAEQIEQLLLFVPHTATLEEAVPAAPVAVP